MRKQITEEAENSKPQSLMKGSWLNLESLAQVEVSSEGPDYPVENAFTIGSTRGWQAAAPGVARITLRFDTPQPVTQIFLHFVEREHERSQEWAISAHFSDGTQHEILRQGWNFSPSGSTEQQETYMLNLKQVVTLSLWIDPDRGQNRYPAALTSWYVGAR